MLAARDSKRPQEMQGLWPPWIPGPHALPRPEVGKRSVLRDLLCPMLPAKRDQEAVYEVTVPTVERQVCLRKRYSLGIFRVPGDSPSKAG